MKNKNKNTTQNIVNYARSQNAYDGNMEITNLKSVKHFDKALTESHPLKKEGQGESEKGTGRTELGT